MTCLLRRRFPIESIDEGEQIARLRDVRHVMTIVDETGDAFPIDENLCGHAPILEELNLLTVKFQRAMGWVRKANEG